MALAYVCTDTCPHSALMGDFTETRTTCVPKCECQRGVYRSSWPYVHAHSRVCGVRARVADTQVEKPYSGGETALRVSPHKQVRPHGEPGHLHTQTHDKAGDK